jgi:hypothetical protein
MLRIIQIAITLFLLLIAIGCFDTSTNNTEASNEETLVGNWILVAEHKADVVETVPESKSNILEFSSSSITIYTPTENRSGTIMQEWGDYSTLDSMITIETAPNPVVFVYEFKADTLLLSSLDDNGTVLEKLYYIPFTHLIPVLSWGDDYLITPGAGGDILGKWTLDYEEVDDYGANYFFIGTMEFSEQNSFCQKSELLYVESNGAIIDGEQLDSILATEDIDNPMKECGTWKTENGIFFGDLPSFNIGDGYSIVDNKLIIHDSEDGDYSLDKI